MQEHVLFAAASKVRLSAATPLATVQAGDRFRFRVDASSVTTKFDLEIVEGTPEDVVGLPEHRQFDVIVEVTAADPAGVVTLETFQQVFDDSSTCYEQPWPDGRIDGVSVRNRFDHMGNLLERTVLSDDPAVVEMADRLAASPVFDFSYLPPAWATPGDSWTLETANDALKQSSKYTLYSDGPCIRGRHCLMMTLDRKVLYSEHHFSHGEYDVVADESGVLVRRSGSISTSWDENEAVATRFSIERIDHPSPRPSWMPDHFGRLRVVLKPWALVWVDGRLNAKEVQTPFCARVPAGRHTVRLVNEYLNRDETIEVVIGASDASIAIVRNWCRHLASGPGCMAELDDDDDLLEMMRDELKGGEIQQLLEPAEP